VREGERERKERRVRWKDKVRGQRKCEKSALRSASHFREIKKRNEIYCFGVK
jgi:hypothetical protein